MRMQEKVGRYWRRAEFACKGKNCCGGSAPISPRLVELLDSIREEANVPLYCVHPEYPNVGSGFRCIRHNREIGSQDTSFHTTGEAADIWSPKMSAAILFAHAQKVIERSGYGWAYTKNGFVHVDTRKGKDD